jgi:hypothetical protein
VIHDLAPATGPLTSARPAADDFYMTGVLELTMIEDLAALRPTTEAKRLDEVTVRALDLVLDANADFDVWFAIGTGALEGRRTAVLRFVHRAGAEGVAPDHGDDGVVAVPAEEAIELCRTFCRRERHTVLAHLGFVERQIDQGAPAPGGDRIARRARVLVRSWVEGG